MRDPAIHPRNACERHAMHEAMERMRRLVRAFPQYRALKHDPIMESAMREHALFFARESCERRKQP
jgi:hypothetical protein